MTDETIVEPPVDPVAVDPAVEPVEPAHAAKEVPAALLARISKEATGRRDAEARASAAERRAQEAEALAARLSATTPKGDAPPLPPARNESDADRQAAIRAEAQNQRFFEDTSDVRNRGMAAAGPKFVEALNILAAANFTTNNEAVADVIAAVGKENAHQMLLDLSKDFEKADALAQMSSRQRIAELTRMSIAKPADTAAAAAVTAASPAQKQQVSKAPPPAPPVQTSATKVKDAYSDEMDDDEFTACWKERMEKRSLRR